MLVRCYRSDDRSALIALWRAAGLVVPTNDPPRDIDFAVASPKRHGGP
jgi:hypothetical protein